MSYLNAEGPGGEEFRFSQAHRLQRVHVALDRLVQADHFAPLAQELGHLAQQLSWPPYHALFVEPRSILIKIWDCCQSR